MILGLTGSSGAIKPPAIDSHPIAAESEWQDRHPQFLSAIERQLASFLSAPSPAFSRAGPPRRRRIGTVHLVSIPRVRFT